MRRETVQLCCTANAADIVPRALTELTRSWPGLRHSHLGRNIEGSWGAGTFTWDLWWEDGAPARDIATQAQAVAGVERADHVVYEPIGGGLRAPQLSGGVWRTLLLQVRPEAQREHVAALEQDLLRMPAYMKGIRNWSLGRVIAGSGWTHVWQQEYSELGDLLGEYLIHPFHWAWVDRWFDPEFPEWTVSTQLCHAFAPLERSLLVRR